MEPTEIIARGDDVLIRFNLIARGRATGIETEQKAFAIWKIDDGKLRSTRFFTNDEDLVAAFEAIGDGA